MSSLINSISKDTITHNFRRSTISATDGRWQHICATWESVTGSWQLLKNGEVAAAGQDLQRGMIFLFSIQSVMHILGFNALLSKELVKVHREKCSLHFLSLHFRISVLITLFRDHSSLLFRDYYNHLIELPRLSRRRASILHSSFLNCAHSDFKFFSPKCNLIIVVKTRQMWFKHLFAVVKLPPLVVWPEGAQ